MTYVEIENAPKRVSGQGGLDYEYKVFNAVKAANVPYLNEGDKPTAGFSNQGAGDLEASYKDQPFNIEIKASAKDQMGGGSFQYDYATKTFAPTKEMDAEDLDLLLAACKEKSPALDRYIEAARNLGPVQYHKDISGVPIKVSKVGREELKKRGLLADINKNVKTDAGFIIKHYNKKGVYYIQIGGSGLFYMGKNPLNLPVPELKADIQIEMRLGFGGGKLSFPTNPPTPARSAGLRVQGRLLTKGKSPYTLDSVEDVQKLFGVSK